jgi:hypothetical protein
MYPNLAEVMAEAGFHKGTGGRVKRPARRADYLMHDGRHGGRFGLVRGSALQVQPFLATLSALTTRDSVLAAGALAL